MNTKSHAVLETPLCASSIRYFSTQVSLGIVRSLAKFHTLSPTSFCCRPHVRKISQFR
jgi:hypothetical protein